MRDEPTTSPRDPAWTRAPLCPAEVWITFGDGDAPLTDAERIDAVSAAIDLCASLGANRRDVACRWFGSRLRVMHRYPSALLDALGRETWGSS